MPETDLRLDAIKRLHFRVLKSEEDKELLKEWMLDIYDEEDIASEIGSADFIEDDFPGFLDDEMGIEVNDDGSLSVWGELGEISTSYLSGMKIRVNHFTSSFVLGDILEDGLVPGVHNVNRDHCDSLGVYVTQRECGPDVDGYTKRALNKFASQAELLGIPNEPICLCANVFLSELSPDMDDEDIESGRYQHVLNSLPPDRIINLDELIDEIRPDLNTLPPANEQAEICLPNEVPQQGPVRVAFEHRNKKAGIVYHNNEFNVDFEPAGYYVRAVTSDMAEKPEPGLTKGFASFKNPLIVEAKFTNWKAEVSDKFADKTGAALSLAIKRAGHDGIITYDENGLDEIVILSDHSIENNYGRIIIDSTLHQRERQASLEYC